MYRRRTESIAQNKIAIHTRHNKKKKKKMRESPSNLQVPSKNAVDFCDRFPNPTTDQRLLLSYLMLCKLFRIS